MAREYEVDQKELMDENISPLHDLDSMDTIAQMRAWFVALTQQLIGLLQEKEQYSRHVLIAKQYIEEHMCEAVSLSDISDYLHLHKVYLARIFKKGNGGNHHPIYSCSTSERSQEANTYYKFEAI